MAAIAALVKYNPCSVHARRGVACPFFISGKARHCAKPLGFCDAPEYDGWFKDVLEGKTKCFYPRRIRLLEIPGTILLLYHVHKRGIVGEAKVLRATSENKMHYYWFDQFLPYPNPVSLKILQTDPRLAKASNLGRWRMMYLSDVTLEEIRKLSELRGESRERLKRELELARLEAERRGPSFLRGELFVPAMETKKLLNLGVEPEILKKAEEIFLEAVKGKLLRGRPSKLMFYVSLYLAHRFLSVPKKWGDFQKMGDFNPKKFKSSMKFLLKKLEMKPPLISPKEWILYYSRNLRISKKTIQVALNLVDDIDVKSPLKHKVPLSISATALYIACVRTDEVISQEKIANTFGVSTVTIRNLAKLWLAYLKRDKMRA